MCASLRWATSKECRRQWCRGHRLLPQLLPPLAPHLLCPLLAASLALRASQMLPAAMLRPQCGEWARPVGAGASAQGAGCGCCKQGGGRRHAATPSWHSMQRERRMPRRGQTPRSSMSLLPSSSSPPHLGTTTFAPAAETGSLATASHTLHFSTRFSPVCASRHTRTEMPCLAQRACFAGPSVCTHIKPALLRCRSLRRVDCNYSAECSAGPSSVQPPSLAQRVAATVQRAAVAVAEQRAAAVQQLQRWGWVGAAAGSGGGCRQCQHVRAQCGMLAIAALLPRI